ncbi:MAG TPA: hypothetical protein VFB96_13760 [Pirellulaceae bacterium]|nr:hypothetical protein [Pirellulaceae bacterium]
MSSTLALRYVVAMPTAFGPQRLSKLAHLGNVHCGMEKFTPS